MVEYFMHVTPIFILVSRQFKCKGFWSLRVFFMLKISSYPNKYCRALTKDLEVINKSQIRLQKPLIDLYEKVLSEVGQDIQNTRNTMFKKVIKVYKREIINEDIWRYKYKIRSYEGEFRFWTAALKLHMTNRLNKYFRIDKEPQG